MSQTALIIGITGNIGRATAHAFMNRGWTIRALHRHPDQARTNVADSALIDWRQGDAINRADIAAAAAGAQVIVHAANPPGYKNWRSRALPMLDNTIDTARTSGASILFPGNMYNYGPDAGEFIAEKAPQNPQTRKGKIRVEMEARLRRAAASGVRSVVVRAGDYFGPAAGASWFSLALVRPGRPVRSVTYPGDPDAGHNWAYLPDVAETFAMVAEREADLDAFETFHFGGHYFNHGIEMADAIRRVANTPDAPIRKLPWLALYAAAPFHTTSRELLEMRYLWQRPLQMNNRKLVQFLGAEPHTPLDAAVRSSLTGLGCLPTVHATAG